MWVSDMIAADKAEPGKHFPPTTQFDMVRHVKHCLALTLSVVARDVWWGGKGEVFVWGCKRGGRMCLRSVPICFPRM
jgi:hypothetical protein